MTWYNLEDDQVDGILNVLYLVIGCSAAISFYLNNPIWFGIMLGVILGAVFYHGFLYNKHKHKTIELQVEARVRAETEQVIKELEIELAQLRK